MPHSVIWLKECAMTMLDLDLKKPTKCKTTASMDVVVSRAIWGLEAKVIIENWRREYNQLRPHSSLGYRPPAPEAYDHGNLTLQVVQ